ncbi:MAG TPA: MoxR family ATPase [Acidimicrobiales bacterium]|nr:MoxR family ATPase [Acidimicrobiales bacterium]
MTTAERTTPRAASFSEYVQRLVDNIETVIQGKRDVVELAVLCLVAEGHMLIEDVPGVGKTSLAKALAASIDGSFGRVQFTPDLLPTDVVGVSVFHRGTDEFEFRSGPIFANVVLADEINRASPKTQAALLEAMAERQVTVDGTTHVLEAPFMVIATQNPIEHEGTYPLPDSQLDRFLLRGSMGYPDRAAELDMLDQHGEHDALEDVRPVLRATDITAMVQAARRIHVAEPLKAYLVDLAEASRRHPALSLGMSPRSVLALQRAARARAAMSGRDFTTPDDVKALAASVVSHRVMITPEAEQQGRDAAGILDEIVASVPVPRATG